MVPRETSPVLKQSLARSVRLERDPSSGAVCVVKRFESPRALGGLLAPWLDRSRARREHALLARLSARGVKVPLPLSIARAGRGWEVRMGRVEGAVSLAAILRGEAPSPLPPERLARALGRLVAALHEAGIDHPDLHAGNALVDPAGQVFAVDFHKARQARALAPGQLRDQLVQLAATSREAWPPRLRARFLLEWRRSLPPALRSELERRFPDLAAFARGVERSARARRRAAVRDRRLRWTRAGSAGRILEDGGARLFERADLAEGFARELAPVLGEGAAPRVLPFPGDPSREVLALRGTRQGRRSTALSEVWYAAARLAEHGIPCARPLCRAIGPGGWIALELPAGCRSVAAFGDQPRALGELCGALHDRGLETPGLTAGELRLAPDGRLLFGGVAALARDDRRAADAIRAWTLRLDLRGEARAAFAAGFAAGDSGGADPRKVEPLRRRVRAALLHGLSSGADGLSAPLARGLLAAAAGLARFSRYERVALANLELALGAETTAAERSRIARGVRRHAARQLYEWSRLARAQRSPLERERVLAWVEGAVELDASFELARDLSARGRGVLIATAHIGNWELLAARLRRAGLAGAVVGFHKENDSAAEWLVAMRRSVGVETILQRTSPRRVLEVLRAGGTLGLLADLHARRIAAVEAPFFGRPAPTMTAPAALARAAAIPVLPARCIAAGEGYRLSFEPPLEYRRDLPRAEAALDLVSRLNAVFERWIREAPEQWSWHQKRW